jgi:hypothetical protein
MDKSKLIKVVIASVALLVAAVLIGMQLFSSSTPGAVQGSVDPSAPKPKPSNRAMPPTDAPAQPSGDQGGEG